MLITPQGDKSGRPDTSGIDKALAETYARRMFDAVLNVNFGLCRELHTELNNDLVLYVACFDEFRELCKSRGMKRGTERWREYVDGN